MTTQQPDRPFEAPEAERGVVGALMLKPELCETIGAYLDATHFADPDLGALYRLALMARAKQMTPDPITLDELSPFLPTGAPTMATAGQIAMAVSSAANAEAYARIVIERHKARQMLSVSQAIADLAGSRGRITEQLARAQALVMDLMGADDSPDVIQLRDALAPVFDDMEARLDNSQSMGLEFGLPDLDKIVQQMRPGNLIIIGGRPGTGKTVLGVGAAEKVAVRDGKSALIFSLEMSAKELAKRTLSSVASVAQTSIDTGTASEDGDSVARMNSAVIKLREADIRICDRGGLPLSRIAAIARFQHRAQPIDLMVVDYIGLVAGEPGVKNLNRNQELGAVSRGLKALAKELNIPIIALAQLNRSIESRGDAKPRMSDLRDSGEIEQDADVIILAHRDMNKQLGQNGVTELDVVKCRHARPGSCLLQFRGEFARFDSVAMATYDDYGDDPDEQPEPKRGRAMSMLKGANR